MNLYRVYKITLRDMLLRYKIVTSSLFSVHILQVSKSTKVLIGPSKEQISGLLRCSSRSFIMPFFEIRFLWNFH